MNQPRRLPTGGRIDRGRPIRLFFNGRPIHGYAGDTVAAMLLANDIHCVGRSFKYHRPRGILSHGSDEPNALLRVERGPGRVDPNTRATVVEAIDGLHVHSQNHWPSLAFDLGAINDLCAPLFAAGFYYKTFMWPRAFWDRLYEPLIRRAAGLGRAPAEPDPDRYLHRYAHCDVLVVGAGPAGLAATLAAAASGKRVMLLDEQLELGGTLLHERSARIDDLPAEDWLREATAAIRSHENVIVLPRTTAFGFYNHNYVAAVERTADHLSDATDLPRERLWQIRAREVVLTTGAHERPLVYPNNDRPGTLLAESIRVYLHRFGVIPGRQVVIATSNASAYQVALDLKAAGVDVTLVDVRADARPEATLARTRGIRVLTGHTILGSIGRTRVRGLIVAPLDGARNAGRAETLPCDCVGMSGGWTPAVHLFSQSRGKLRFSEDADAFVPGDAVQATRSAGACTGTYELTDCLIEGWRAGARAAGSESSRAFATSPLTTRGGSRASQADRVEDRPRGRCFVDFQNDVTTDDLRLAVREGFESVEHVKRYTTSGMATDQGKTSGMNTLAVLSSVLSRPVPQLGTTTFRPPYTPVSFGALAGEARGALFDPARVTPIHSWHVARGAKFENVGAWRRAWYYPAAAEDMHSAVKRECRAVRASAGIFDASTLGKIEVVGPDAAEFMNRMYINGWTKLEPGRCRYGIMLKEDGHVFDDGVVARLAADRFHVTTTTGGAPRVLAHMEEYLQTEWPDLRVFLTSITEQWAVIGLQGPRAREILTPLVSDIDLSPAAFPHMCVRIGHIGRVPVRLFRVSFSGELGYEINVPAEHGQMVWESVFESGRRFGVEPYGTETMHVLRAECGFIIVGQETDGTVTPHDLGFAAMIAQKKGDFVGRRSLDRPDPSRADRKQLVGLLTRAPDIVLEPGAQIVLDTHQPTPMHMVGHVTSGYWSEACGRSISLALLASGRTMHGRSVHVTTSRGFAEATVTEPTFINTQGRAANA